MSPETRDPGPETCTQSTEETNEFFEVQEKR
jgi:hypothetical protein